MLKTTLASLALCLSLAMAAAVSAHTAKPKHGGIVREAGDLSLELVVAGDSATLHVDDHGKPADTAGMSGKLTVLNGSETTEAALAPAGSNRLEAKGLKFGKGARVVAVMTTAQKKTVTARFVLK
jgi:hypothetical protein